MLRTKNIVKLLFLLLIFFSAVSLFARDVTITVIDMDLEIPLEGATVRLWDGSELICDENGIVTIHPPADRQVVIQAAYPGYETGRLVVTTTGDSFTVTLHLTGVMENRELVIEASRPGTNESRTGRSVAISGRDMAQTAEIGIIEDVMSSIKLLPGVGYAGFFNALPSIRGGYPGDLRASFDGFYVMNPYHWGGGFSIFDPRMVESAQLSHGVFSSRHGHTISGLLEITSRNPSPTETMFELGMNTSAANFSLSVPLSGNGGILFMGRVTYYDPVFALARELGKTIDALSVVDSMRVAPYIRNFAVTGNYRFADDLEFSATGFWGMDGVGATFDNSGGTSRSFMDADWTNYQGFIRAGLLWNPRNDMLLNFSIGTGFEETIMDADFEYRVYNNNFSSSTWWYDYLNSEIPLGGSYNISTGDIFKQSDLMFNIQARADFDWELGDGFLFAAGLQEMYSRYRAKGSQHIFVEKRLSNYDLVDQYELFAHMGAITIGLQDFLREHLVISTPLRYNPDASNSILTTSGYALLEYHTPNNRINAELGLRIDHFFLSGRNISVQSQPALNPRLNFDFNIYNGTGFIQSINISTGTGLFSSVDTNIFAAEAQYDLDKLKPSRSWTSILGARLEFQDGFIFNIEFYYKHIFDRTYIPVRAELDGISVRPRFDGEGRVWGIDLMILKLQSRFFDGWLSYSFNWAQYRDPHSAGADYALSTGGVTNDWHFPDFHRFHNLNLVLNFRPAQNINIYTRFGLASGVQQLRRIGDTPVSYPVYVYDPENPGNNQFIEMFFWPSRRDKNNRTTVSLPMDVKFSIFGGHRSGRTRYEVYVAVENVLALLYTSQENTTFNRYTGNFDTGSTTASYEMPIPIPSFGFKLSY